MALTTLAVHDLRGIERADLEFSAGLNLITGPNGSGKTTLLEGVFLLGRGRSFRTRNLERLIRAGASRMVCFGRTRERQIGVQVTRGAATATEARLDALPVDSLSELATALPVQVINPEIHRLVEDGPYRRRRWLDWAVFHVEPGFLAVWQRYQRTLKQRNAALRRPGGELVAWNAELAAHGEALSRVRARLVDRLQPFWSELAEPLSGVPVALSYQRGWSEEVGLLEALTRTEPRDRERGSTGSGPHRAEVSLRVEGRAAREILSRGQQKLIAIALVLAQLELLRAEVGLRPTLLLDDPQAELDGQRVGAFLARVQRLPCQLIVTSLHAEFDLLGRAERVFHVERGRVQPR
jgi:DNA replication and repair protein RecF